MHTGPVRQVPHLTEEPKSQADLCVRACACVRVVCACVRAGVCVVCVWCVRVCVCVCVRVCVRACV